MSNKLYEQSLEFFIFSFNQYSSIYIFTFIEWTIFDYNILDFTSIFIELTTFYLQFIKNYKAFLN